MHRTMTFEQFQQGLVRGQVEPVYLFDGEEIFFHEEGIRLLGQSVLSDGVRSIDRESIRGGDTALHEILDIASTYPMGGGVRLIVVRETDEIRTEDLTPLKDYLARPNPRSCLIFSDARFDRRRLLYKTLIAGAARVDCGALDEARTARWVRERLRARGFGISADLAEAVAAGGGGSGLARLDAELQKLMSALGSPRPIEPSDLAILADVPRVADAFRLAAQIARGERGAALIAVRALLRSGEDPVHLLGGLSWYFRNALKAFAAASHRLPPREVQAVYGLDPGRVERFQREIGTASISVLQEALSLCHRADMELKGRGARDPAQAFERLIHRVGRRQEITA
jgi:DNA polymerase III subunit delta